MHELSIAQSLVELALDNLPDEPGTVGALYLNLGVLAGVDQAALHFGYEIVTAGTRLQGSQLVIQEIPVTIFCPRCQQVVPVAHPARMCCSVCGERSGDLRSGKELALSALDFVPLTQEVEASLNTQETPKT